MCAEEGVRREYNPFVSSVSVATAVVKKQKLNKQNIFLSLRGGNPSPSA